MNNYFIFIVLIATTSNLFAAKPPTMSTTEQYVSLALANDVAKLKGAGAYTCKFAVLVNNYGKDPDYEARGKTFEEAQQRLGLLCIKERCNQVGQWIMGGFAQIDKISDGDNVEFFKAQGYTDEEIEIILKNKKNMDRSSINQMTCATSTPLARMVVVDSCFMQPMECRQ